MIKTLSKLGIGAVAAGLLVGCVEDTGSTSPRPPGNSVEQQARVNCMVAVTRETGNRETSIISSEFSEAGTRVVVGVGTRRAPWECIAHTDGSTTRPMSLSNEGFL